MYVYESACVWDSLSRGQVGNPVSHVPPQTRRTGERTNDGSGPMKAFTGKKKQHHTLITVILESMLTDYRIVVAGGPYRRNGVIKRPPYLSPLLHFLVQLEVAAGIHAHYKRACALCTNKGLRPADSA